MADAPNAGWFGYAPITGIAYNPGHGIDFWILSLQILGIASLAAGQSLVTRYSKQPVVPSIDVIDCHTHFYDPERPQGIPWPEKGSSLYRTVLPEHLRALPHAIPVTGTIIVEASSWLEDNQWLLDIAADDPFVVGIVGHLNGVNGSLKILSEVTRFKA